MNQKPEPFMFIFDDKKQVTLFYTTYTTPIIALAVQKFNFNYKIITRANMANDWLSSCPDKATDFKQLTDIIQGRVSEKGLAHFESGGVLSFFCFDGFVSVGPYDTAVTELDAAMIALRSKDAYCDIIPHSEVDSYLDTQLPKRYDEEMQAVVRERVKGAKEKWQTVFDQNNGYGKTVFH